MFAAVMKISLLALTLFSIFSCSSGPATSYYSLFPSTSPATGSVPDGVLSNAETVLGVALVDLPGYLDTSAIVSRSNGQKLNVSGYHAWAEPLDEAITRALTGNLRLLLTGQKLVSFPWDMRLRPDLQLRVVFDQFDGERGDAVALSASWSIYSVSKKKVLNSGHIVESIQITSTSYEVYVSTLNALLFKLAQGIAADFNG